METGGATQWGAVLQIPQRDDVEKAAQADAADEEHDRDEQMNHAADNNTALELGSSETPRSSSGAFTGTGLSLLAKEYTAYLLFRRWLLPDQ